MFFMFFCDLPLSSCFCMVFDAIFTNIDDVLLINPSARVIVFRDFKGTPLGLRQILATESPLRMMKNAFYFTFTALFVCDIFQFLFCIFVHVRRNLDKKGKVNLHKKSCTKCGGETSLKFIFKRSKLSISLYQQSEFSYSLFLLYVQIEEYQDTLKRRCLPLAFTSHKGFPKNKKRSGAGPPASFFA